jgi:hypothetical protein
MENILVGTSVHYFKNSNQRKQMGLPLISKQQNYRQSRQKLGTFLGYKIFGNQSFQNISLIKVIFTILIYEQVVNNFGSSDLAQRQQV